MCRKSGLNPEAAAFKPAPRPAQVNGVCIEGTDAGALNREFFYVEAQTERFRTILPHGHITCDMFGRIANISYTHRNGQKIATVFSEEHWLAIKADSGPIYNGLAQVVGRV